MAKVKLNLSGHANQSLDDLGFVFPGALHVDLTDPDLGAKVANFLSPLMGSGDQVLIALPGLSPLASIVLAVIHGLTGQFPQVQPLIRQADGSFVAGNPLDLQSLRNDVARADHRQGVVKL